MGKKSKHDKRKEKQKQHDEKEVDENIATKSNQHEEDEDFYENMTDAERKSLKFKSYREEKDLEKIAKQSHRERVEMFNEKLSKLTEHNDIPRVSAAGNG